jgi:hypothetical protein
VRNFPGRYSSQHPKIIEQIRNLQEEDMIRNLESDIMQSWRYAPDGPGGRPVISEKIEDEFLAKDDEERDRQAGLDLMRHRELVESVVALIQNVETQPLLEIDKESRVFVDLRCRYGATLIAVAQELYQKGERRPKVLRGFDSDPKNIERALQALSQIDPDIQKLVSFEVMNLQDPDDLKNKMEGKTPVAFHMNIFLAHMRKYREILQRLYEMLPAGGALHAQEPMPYINLLANQAWQFPLSLMDIINMQTGANITRGEDLVNLKNQTNLVNASFEFNTDETHVLAGERGKGWVRNAMKALKKAAESISKGCVMGDGNLSEFPLTPRDAEIIEGLRKGATSGSGADNELLAGLDRNKFIPTAANITKLADVCLDILLRAMDGGASGTATFAESTIWKGVPQVASVIN